MYSESNTNNPNCQINTQAMVNGLGQSRKPSITTVEIAELTGKNHNHVMRDTKGMLTELYGEEGLSKFGQTYIHPQNKQTYPCYRLPKKEVLVLVSGYSTKLRMKIITRLEELESKIRPENLSRLDILKIAMVAEEKRLALEAENKEMKPKALFADAVSASTSSILIGELAKILRQNGILTGQNRFFAWLRENGYLIKRKGTDYNMPTQKSMELGLFEIKERTIVNPDDSTRITKTSKVTGKGQQYFINMFLSQAAGALPEA